LCPRSPVTERASTISQGGDSDDDWLHQILAERYRVDARIGRGGMGIVYRGTHLELGKRVAIKRLDARLAVDASSFERFRREALAACRIESPYVVQVFDWGKAKDNSPFIVMELLDGRSLRDHFEREGRLEAVEASAIAVQILKGLYRIHQAQVLHRDLKPENVFLCDYNEEAPFVKLLDFGISKQLLTTATAEQVTDTGVVLGTATYMSPEQAKGDKELDARSDLYSLGAVLYEALTGTAPHRGMTYAAILVDICTRDADDVRLHCPLIPEALALVVKRALERDRDARFSTALEFLDALVDAVPSLNLRKDSGRRSQPPEVTRTSSSPPKRARDNGTIAHASTELKPVKTSKTLKPRRLPPAFKALSLALALLVLSAIAFFKMQSRPQQEEAPHASMNAQGNPSLPTTVPTTFAPLNPTEVTSATILPMGSSASPFKNVDAKRVPSVKPQAYTTKKPIHPTKPSVAPSSTLGVAGELKLRRTMP
jgi:eukaryotic-like serine/threonine-protein kinase